MNEILKDPVILSQLKEIIKQEIITLAAEKEASELKEREEYMNERHERMFSRELAELIPPPEEELKKFHVKKRWETKVLVYNKFKDTKEKNPNLGFTQVADIVAKELNYMNGASILAILRRAGVSNFAHRRQVLRDKEKEIKEILNDTLVKLRSLGLDNYQIRMVLRESTPDIDY